MKKKDGYILKSEFEKYIMTHIANLQMLDTRNADIKIAGLYESIKLLDKFPISKEFD